MAGGGYTEWLLTASQGNTLRLDLQVDVAFKGLLGDGVCHTPEVLYHPPKSSSPSWRPDIQARENSESLWPFLEVKVQLFTGIDT